MGASRLARSVLRSARKRRGGADAIAKSFTCFDRRRDCGGALRLCRPRSSASRADRTGQLRRGGPHGRRRRERQARRFDPDHLRGQRQRRQVQLPRVQARARPLFARHSRRGLRHRRSEDGGCRRRQHRHRRYQAAADPQFGKAAQQCGMAGKLSRDRYPEEDAAQLHRLSRSRPHRHLHPRRRGVRAGVQPHDRLLSRQHATASAAAHRGSRRNLGAAAGVKAMAEYLASVNLSRDEVWDYPLKTLPRPQGRATRVVITEYDLPRKQIQPHDAIVDSDGMVWFTHFGEQFLGKLDPKSGRVSEYPLPVIKPGYPVGTLDLETDKAGNLWIAMMYQGGVAKFDKKTETFQTWKVPQQWQTDATQQAFLTPAYSHVDGKVWVKNSDRAQILRLDPATGEWENLGSFKDPSNNRTITSYGIPADHENNLYLLDFSSSNIGKLDAKTGNLTVYRSPIANSRPRRGRVDEHDRLWFAEYAGNAIGMFDPKTEKIEEWVLPTPWAQPYDVVTDKNGEAWMGSMLSDRVSRLNPKTGEFVEYLLPRTTNIRRVFVDNSTTPVTFWVGSNHGASIVKVEPMD